MNRRIIAIFIAFTVLTGAFYACNKPNDNITQNTDTFDKAAMLADYADNMIVPGYKSLQSELAKLKTASDAFVNSPSDATQAPLKEAFKNAYLQYQRVVAFQFGPAETALLDIYANYAGGIDYSFATAGQLTGFSVDTATIENNISSGTYNLATNSRSVLYSQGFPALGYLYFAPGAAGKFSTNTAARIKYVNDVLSRLTTLVDGVVGAWPTYRTEFIANTKTNVGSPIGNIVNQIAYQLDITKGPRIGWPLGKASNGTTFSDKCEGFYAGISAALAKENIASLKKVYTGSTAGRGLADYLKALKKETLNADVLAQFDITISALQQINDPMSASITTQTTTIDAAYKEVQKLLTLIKTDVASATAVQITFTDNDGD